MRERTIRFVFLLVLFIAVFALKSVFGWSGIDYFMVISTALLTLIYLRVSEQ